MRRLLAALAIAVAGGLALGACQGFGPYCMARAATGPQPSCSGVTP